MNVAVTREDESHSVPSQVAVKLPKSFRNKPVFVGEAFCRRGTDEAVPDFNRSYSSRPKQGRHVCDIHIRHPDNPSALQRIGSCIPPYDRLKFGKLDLRVIRMSEI